MTATNGKLWLSDYANLTHVTNLPISPCYVNYSDLEVDTSLFNGSHTVKHDDNIVDNMPSLTTFTENVY